MTDRMEPIAPSDQSSPKTFVWGLAAAAAGLASWLAGSGLPPLSMAAALNKATAPAAATVHRRPDAEATFSFDLRYLSEHNVRSVYLSVAERLLYRIDADGAFRANARGPFAIQRQRRAFEVVAGGVLSTGGDRANLLDTGLRAIEWGYARSGPNGSFPEQVGGVSGPVLPKAFFVEAAARSLLLVRAANLEPAFEARAHALAPAVARSATWIAGSEGLARTVENGINVNQLFVAAAALQGAGVLVSDEALKRRARDVIEEALGRQKDDGSFPERGGFDSNYQSVSLEFLARYAQMLEPSEWRDKVVATIRRGSDRLMSAIDPATGRIDASKNTRTVPCGPAAPNEGRLSSDGLPLRLRYVSMLLNEPRIADAADRVDEVGQAFKHMEKCAANDN